MTRGIENKVVVITGASSGLGEAAARHLAKHGAKLVLGARRLDRLQARVKELSLSDAAVAQTDVTQRAQVESLVDRAVQNHGRIDVLINNAGLMPNSFLERLQVAEWDRMIDVNIKGVLYGIAAALPHMIARKSGHIINVSSVAGHKVGPGGAVYAATKHAVRVISEGLPPGGQAAQQPHDDHLAGRGRYGVDRDYHRPDGRRGNGPSLRQRHSRRFFRPGGRLRHERAGGRRRQRNPLQADRPSLLSKPFELFRARKAGLLRPRPCSLRRFTPTRASRG